MSEFAQLATDIQQAMAEHRGSLGGTNNDRKQKQRVINILLWENWHEIVGALKIAGTRVVNPSAAPKTSEAPTARS